MVLRFFSREHYCISDKKKTHPTQLSAYIFLGSTKSLKSQKAIIIAIGVIMQCITAATAHVFRLVI